MSRSRQIQMKQRFNSARKLAKNLEEEQFFVVLIYEFLDGYMEKKGTGLLHLTSPQRLHGLFIQREPIMLHEKEQQSAANDSAMEESL